MMPEAGPRTRCGGAAGRVLYGALFAVVWPAWLVVLAVRVRVPFPAVQAPLFGLVLTVAAWRSWASVWRASSGAATGCR